VIFGAATPAGLSERDFCGVLPILRGLLMNRRSIGKVPGDAAGDETNSWRRVSGRPLKNGDKKEDAGEYRKRERVRRLRGTRCEWQVSPA